MDHIGIDLHKRDSQIYFLSDTGEVTECRVLTSRERFAAVLGDRPHAKVLLEASTEREWVASCLEGLGHEVIVADPNYAPMYGARTRAIKTDRRDAAALAEACRIGAYRAVHRVSAAQRQVRQQLRVRKTLVATRRRIIAMVRALCRGEGIRLRGGAAEHFLHRLAEVALPPSLADTFAPVLALLSNLEDQLAIADRTITEVAARDVAVQRLMTVPGVGPIIGTAFVAALDTRRDFREAGKSRATWGWCRARTVRPSGVIGATSRKPAIRGCTGCSCKPRGPSGSHATNGRRLCATGPIILPLDAGRGSPWSP